MSKLHQKIKEARARSGLTQGDIAKACGLTRNAVTLWESSNPTRRTAPQIREINILCKMTGAPRDWLLSDESGLNDAWAVGSNSKLSPAEEALIVTFRLCSPTKQAAIIAFLEFTASTKAPASQGSTTESRLG